MWVLLILVVLCLGYASSTSTPAGKATLKRSEGWGAYAHLGKNGLALLWQGVLITLVFIVFLYILATLGYLFLWLEWIDKSPYSYITLALSFDAYRGIKIYELLVVFFAFSYHIDQLKKDKKKSDWVIELKNQDAVLNLILEAAESMTPLRVSLKSRKVYIGLVESEQFERADLDNLVLIPYLSGHRDKDTLEMRIDHNYFFVYEKNKILEPGNFVNLSKFRVVIRLDEVDSISLFDLKYFSDFHDDNNGSD